jgi:hypothetical protein
MRVLEKFFLEPDPNVTAVSLKAARTIYEFKLVSRLIRIIVIYPSTYQD